MKEVFINGCRYDFYTGEFSLYMSLPKRLYKVSGYINGDFMFSNGSKGKIGVFANCKGKPMIFLSGKFTGIAYDLVSYLSARRADLTTWVNNQDGGSDIDIDL